MVLGSYGFIITNKCCWSGTRLIQYLIWNCLLPLVPVIPVYTCACICTLNSENESHWFSPFLDAQYTFSPWKWSLISLSPSIIHWYHIQFLLSSWEKNWIENRLNESADFCFYHQSSKKSNVLTLSAWHGKYCSSLIDHIGRITLICFTLLLLCYWSTQFWSAVF